MASQFKRIKLRIKGINELRKAVSKQRRAKNTARVVGAILEIKEKKIRNPRRKARIIRSLTKRARRTQSRK